VHRNSNAYAHSNRDSNGNTDGHAASYTNPDGDSECNAAASADSRA
jgi:hypothetical protein